MSTFRLKLDKLSNFFRHSTGERKIDVRKVIAFGSVFGCFLFPFVGPSIPGQYDVSSKHTTVRVEELRKIREQIMRKIEDGEDPFITVQGPEGLGKTTLVENAVSIFPCVRVDVTPGQGKRVIYDSFVKSVAGYFPPVIWGLSYWRWVIYYRTFFSDKPFVVVLSAASRNANEEPAELTTAARSISKKFGGKVVVIVDASDDAYVPEVGILSNKDDLNIQLLPLKKKELMELDQLSKLKERPQYEQLFNDLYAVFGGVPLNWRKPTIQSIFKDDLADEKMRVEAIYSFLTERVNSESALLMPFLSGFGAKLKKWTTFNSEKQFENRKNALLKAIYSEFSKPSSGLDVSSELLNFPDKKCIPTGNNVLRKIGKQYSPHTPVMAFVLRHNIKSMITVDELKAFIKKDHENGITLQ